MEAAMLPNVITGPTKVSGGIVARVVKLPDGSGRIESWERGGWTETDTVTLDEFMPGAGLPVNKETRLRLGIPLSELCPGEGLR